MNSAVQAFTKVLNYQSVLLRYTFLSTKKSLVDMNRGKNRVSISPAVERSWYQCLNTVSQINPSNTEVVDRRDKARLKYSGCLNIIYNEYNIIINRTLLYTVNFYITQMCKDGRFALHQLKNFAPDFKS